MSVSDDLALFGAARIFQKFKQLAECGYSVAMTLEKTIQIIDFKEQSESTDHGKLKEDAIEMIRILGPAFRVEEKVQDYTVTRTVWFIGINILRFIYLDGRQVEAYATFGDVEFAFPCLLPEHQAAENFRARMVDMLD